MLQDLCKFLTAAALVFGLSIPVSAADAAAAPHASATSHSKSSSKTKSKRHLAPSRYNGYAPTYADSVSADDPKFDDPVVREAAVSALGRYNGSVVAVDPNTGRILAVVNQRIAV